MKKKWLCLLFALLMVGSLAACGDNSKDTSSDNGKSDFESFKEVQKNMQDIKDMEFKMDIKAEVPSKDGDFNLTMSGSGKEIAKSEDDIRMAMKYKMNSAGTEMDGTMYMKDNAIYTDMMGQKIKTDASGQLGAMAKMDVDSLLAISEDMISDLKASKDGSDTVYNFTMDANKALDYFSKNAAGAGGIDKATEGITFDKMNVSIKVDKDQKAKSIDMDFSMKIDLDGEQTTMNYKMTMEIVSINTDLQIKFPDFSDYKEMNV